MNIVMAIVIIWLFFHMEFVQFQLFRSGSFVHSAENSTLFSALVTKGLTQQKKIGIIKNGFMTF
jgi:hypothetical protein